MAYAYNSIDDMMGNQQNQNIFGADQQNQQPNQNQNVTGSNPAVKTTTEGDINANPAATSSSGPKVNSTSSAEQSRETTQKAYQQNVGKTQKPAAFQGIQQGIDTAKTGLAQKAQDYAAAQNAKQNYTLDQGTLNNAVEGDSAASAKTSDLLSRQTYNPVDSFDYGDLSVKDANLLDTNAGIKQLVSRGQRATYTPQMAAFDTMLLQMDPSFRNEVQGLKKQANDLQSTADTTKTDVEKAANDAAQANLATAQKQARDYLGSQSSAIQAQNEQEAAARNAALQQIDLGKIGSDAQAQARAAAQARLDQLFGAGRAANQLAGVNIDPSQFVTRGAAANADQFWSADDARRYNQINALLGQGGKAAVESGALGPDYNVNQGGLLDALLNPAIQARQTADTADTKQIQDMLAAAQARADADDQRRAGLLSNYQSDITKMIRDAAPMAAYNPYRDILGNDEALKQISGTFARNNPILNNLDLGSKDVLTQAEADRLNSLAQDLGSSDRYQAGGYQQGGQQSFIDQSNFQKNLLDALSAYRATPEGQASLARANPQPAQPVFTAPGTAQIGQQNNPTMQNPNTFTFVGANRPVWDNGGGLDNPNQILQRVTPGQNFNVQTSSAGNNKNQIAQQSLITSLLPSLLGGY